MPFAGDENEGEANGSKTSRAETGKGAWFGDPLRAEKVRNRLIGQVSAQPQAVPRGKGEVTHNRELIKKQHTVRGHPGVQTPLQAGPPGPVAVPINPHTARGVGLQGARKARGGHSVSARSWKPHQSTWDRLLRVGNLLDEPIEVSS